MKGIFRKCIIYQLVGCNNNDMRSVMNTDVVTSEADGFLTAFVVKNNLIGDWLFKTSDIIKSEFKNNLNYIYTNHSMYVFKKTAYALTDGYEIYRVNKEG